MRGLECVSTSQDKLWARSRKNLLEKGLDLLSVPCGEPVMGCSPLGTTMLGYGWSLSSFSKGNFLRKCLLATRSFNEATCKDLTVAQKPFLQSPPGNFLSMRCWCEYSTSISTLGRVQTRGGGGGRDGRIHPYLPPLFLP